MREVLDFIKGKNVLIIGPPGSGKTFLAKRLALGQKLIHTDDFIKDRSCETILKSITNPCVIEGCLGYLLLKKGYSPDVVIEIEITDDQVKQIEKIRNKNYSAFNKANRTILNEYLLNRKNEPIWIKTKNKYAGTI